MDIKESLQAKKLLWGDKRYHSLNYYLRNTFGEKVFKVSLNAGFTCPNRDGKVSYGGCIFCSLQGSGEFAGNPQHSLEEQFKQGIKRLHKKWPKVTKYIAYFQPFSNTYASVEELRKIYKYALNMEGVVGIAIATRPDCLSEEILDLLSELNEKTHLWVELGLQSIHDKTGRLINRGYHTSCFLNAVKMLYKRNIKTVVHIILGLPGENKEDMLKTAKYVAALPIQGIKIHMLYLLKNTALEKMYAKRDVEFLSPQAYINLVIDILELLPPEIVIHRLVGDAPKETLIGPLWCRRKRQILSRIDKRLLERKTWQGRLSSVKKG